MKTLYKELTPQEFREKRDEMPVAYLPLGTLEWHGEHMPLGTDAIQPEGLFVNIAKKIGGVVLPTLFIGPDLSETVDGKVYYGMETQGKKRQAEELRYEHQVLAGSCYWVEADIFKKMLRGILAQMQRAGIKILVAHGHGPSTMFFINNSEEFYKDFGIKCLHCWSHYLNDKVDIQFECFQTGHGGVNETSIVMALKPSLVQMDRIKGEKYLVGISDDPRETASAEVGEKVLKIAEKKIIDNIQSTLKELGITE